jgi:hypothetical protein
MTNQQLQAQFQKCQEWNDADQWDALPEVMLLAEARP